MDTARPNVAPNLRTEWCATSGRPLQSHGESGTAAPMAVACPRFRVQAAPWWHFPWLEARTGCVLSRNARAIEAVDGEGRVRGMVGYDGWTENSVQAHMAVDAPAVWRRLLRPAFSYPFEEAGKGLLLGLIPADNARSARLARRFGFRLAHRVLDGWAQGVDLLCFEMRRAECRWLSEVPHG